MSRALTLIAAVSLGLSLATPSQALPAGAALGARGGSVAAVPKAAQQVDLEEQLGRRLPLDLTFTDESGRSVRLGDALGGRPAILTLAYFRCPSLCGLVLRGVGRGLGQLGFTLGDRVQALTVSIDPRDGPTEAARAQATALRDAGQPGKTSGWPFLVGREPEIRALADAVGFRYAYDQATDQYAHPAAVFVVTPDGRVARVLYGVRPSALDLRLALVEAGEGRIGTIADRVLLTCYRYDPTTRRYGAAVRTFFRLGGAVVLAAVGGLVGVLARRERSRRGRPAP
jgi:protein SCO1/2